MNNHKSLLRRVKLLLLIFAILITSTRIYAKDNDAKLTNASRPNVLLISIDGLKPEYILNADKYDLKIPNIKNFIKNGSYAPKGILGVMPTMTYPSHAAIMTGTNPATNGIENNFIFNPDAHEDWYFFVSKQVDNLWSAATKNGYITANLGIPVSIGANINYNFPTLRITTRKIDLQYINQLCEPKGLLDELSKNIGPYNIELKKDNHIAEDIWKFKAAEWLLNNNIKNDISKTNKPVFMSMYFLDLDTIQHDHGLHTKKAKKSIEAIDKMIGRLIETFKKTVGENYIINIVSDHGFVDVSYDININTGLKDAGFITLDSNDKIKDWKAYGWYAAGMCGIVLKDPNNKNLYNEVHNYLLKLVENPENGIKTVFTKEELIKKKAFKSASFALSAKHGYRFNKNISGKLITKSTTSATHGFDPNDNELKASYFIEGSNIPKNKKLYNVKLIDIAPTLAELMGFNLKTAEGKVIKFQ
jgi:predicted AlkP superfamily pyrophosphatase or phosphodiesterase